VLVEVHWAHLRRRSDPRWDDQLCLYAYLHPGRDWLLYVGKCDYSTVRGRLRGDHKKSLFAELRKNFGSSSVRVLCGEILLSEGSRRTSALLSDVETLLIKRLKPFGNIQSRHSRIERPGMRVHCVGGWPFRRWRFHDK
jgi:hypothetical protein